jgi:endonuclease YncB( thermonuclease family)
MKRVLGLVALLAAMALPLIPVEPVGAATLPKGVPAGAQVARIWGWIDGDKVKMRVGSVTEELLLIGADAPEIENGDGFEECFAKEASNHIRT